MDYLTDFDWHTAVPKTIKGHLYFCAPEHPLASKNPSSILFGLVKVARHIVSVKRGNWLRRNELVFFKDGDPTNIDPDNMQVGKPPSNKVTLICPVCKNHYKVTPSLAKIRITDTRECYITLKRKFSPTSEELWSLVWKHPQTHVAKMFNVQPRAKAVYKRCKELGVTLPPSGYWTMIRAGRSSDEALKRLGWQPEAISSLRETLSLLAKDALVEEPQQVTNYLTDFDWRNTVKENKKGEQYFRAPEHPLARKSGWVKLVRHIASVERGKWLEPNELVSFKDGNDKNLKPDNLLVVNKGYVLRGCGPGRGRGGGRVRVSKVTLICPVCKNSFIEWAGRAKHRVFDTPECSRISRRKFFNPKPEELWSLVWKYPQIEIAKMFNVNRQPIRFYCKTFGIVLPPPGYWRLIEIGRSHEEALKRLGWQAETIGALNNTLGHAQDTFVMTPSSNGVL